MEVTTLAMTFVAVTNLFSLPPGLLSSVCAVESGHNVRVINHMDGKSHSYGVCQIKLDTARSVGYVGNAEGLMNPKVNILFAGAYLKKQLLRYNMVIPKGVAAYNSGTLMLNDRGQIRNSKYVKKVLTQWAEAK